MMNDLPDVAGSLFTNQYKAVKIEGKKLKPNALEGTGSVSGACKQHTDHQVPISIWLNTVLSLHAANAVLLQLHLNLLKLSMLEIIQVLLQRLLLSICLA